MRARFNQDGHLLLEAETELETELLWRMSNDKAFLHVCASGYNMETQMRDVEIVVSESRRDMPT